MNGIDYITSILKEEGVESITCFPTNPVIEAAAKIGIRPVMFRHERGAVMAADGFSRTSDRQRFGVVAVQSQAGAENAMGGIAQAYADNIPILVLPGGVMRNQISVRPNFSAAANYGGIAKHVEAIYEPGQVGDVMRRAFHALRNGAPGPVVVELIADACHQEVPERGLTYRSPKTTLQCPTVGDLRDAARLLLEAKKPLIWAGAGVLSAGATEELRTLAELAGAPVFCTMPGKSAMNETHPLALGAGSGMTTLPAHRWLSECDVLLCLGSSLTRTPYGQRIHSGKTLIQNTNNPDEINKDESVDLALVGDAKLVIEGLIDEVKARVGEDGVGDAAEVKAEIAALRAEWLETWNPLLHSNETPLNTYRVIHEIDTVLDRDNSMVTHDAGAPRDSMVPFYTATTPHSYIGWGKTTHLGFGIPLMIGAKLAHPDRFCLNMMGDGAFGMSGLDIETSVRAGLPITTVLLHNEGMATYPDGFFPVAREEFGVSKMQGDYAKLAEGMGAVGITVTEVEEMAPALRSAQRHNAEGQSVLIDVRSNMEGRRSAFR